MLPVRVQDIRPKTRAQRYRIHKAANVTGARPKSLHDGARSDLQDIGMVETRKEAEAAFNLFVETHGVKYGKAVRKMVKDREETMPFRPNTGSTSVPPIQSRASSRPSGTAQGED